MAFKFNIGTKSGKTFKLESDAPSLVDKPIRSVVKGEEISPDLAGYEFEISGASDASGFTLMEDVPGVGLKGVILGYGKGMHKRPRREGKKKVSNFRPNGLRMRKTVRGRIISNDVVQINLVVLKEGGKKLEEVFPDQVKAPESAAPEQTA
jgi:small subunit ribosomal protein S6e